VHCNHLLTADLYVCDVICVIGLLCTAHNMHTTQQPPVTSRVKAGPNRPHVVRVRPVIRTSAYLEEKQSGATLSGKGTNQLEGEAKLQRATKSQACQPVAASRVFLT